MQLQKASERPVLFFSKYKNVSVSKARVVDTVQYFKLKRKRHIFIPKILNSTARTTNKWLT